MASSVAAVRELLSPRAAGLVTHGPSNGKVVFWIDIFLVLCLAVFVIPFLPQIYGRLRTKTEWGKGLLACKYHETTTCLTFANLAHCANSRSRKDHH